MVDFAEQRLNMVESQVRPNDLTDRRITSAMLEVAREAYLPAALQGVAYSDGELSLAAIEGAMTDRLVLSPRTIAQMIQALDLEARDVVLLIGTGSGYEAALLSLIAQTVVCIES
ncbi:MAG: protein-L-isoaspartate O-methyltransferase family protein, partial [Hyphomicrobiaceae bacterium]